MFGKDRKEGGELDPDEYRRLEGIIGSPYDLSADSKKYKGLPRLRRQKHKYYEETPLDTFILFTLLSLPILVPSGALLFVDQSKKDHPVQPFKIPAKEHVVEVDNPPQSSRQFIASALVAGKIACPESFVREGNIQLTKPLLPVVRTEVEFPADKVVVTKGSVSSNTELDRIVTCSYPESDPHEIMHIPVVREGQ